MIVTTTSEIAGYQIIEYKGIVRGLIVRAPTILQGFASKLKNIIGGKLGALTKMCEQTRQQAYDLMVKHAIALEANAILCVRYDATMALTATEVLCYGTAVVVKKV